MFDGFTLETVAVGGAVPRVRHGGQGPPVLLLHGHPRTHTTWYRVAPLLARTHSVICPDLPRYGESCVTGEQPSHRTYCDRAMAGQLHALMNQLGHDQYAVAGHDRGCNVAFRLALDHPNAVQRLIVLVSGR